MIETLANAYCLTHDCGSLPWPVSITLGVIGVAGIYFTLKDWWDKR